MGQPISIEEGRSEKDDNTKAITALVYEKGALSSILIPAFLGKAESNPSTYLANPIVIVEPQNASPPQVVQYSATPASVKAVSKLINQYFRVSQYQQKNYQLILLSPKNSIESLPISQLKTFDFLKKSSSCKAALPSTLLTDSDGLSSVMQAIQLSAAPPKRRICPIKCQTSLPVSLNHDSFRESEASEDLSEIVPGVFIGGERSATNKEVLIKNGITHVVNLNGRGTPSPFAEFITYFIMQMNDSCFEDFNNKKDTLDALNFMKKAVGQGGKILVHCKLGLSRSPALCAAYLMDVRSITFEEAESLIIAKQKNISINQGYADQLRIWRKVPQ